MELDQNGCPIDRLAGGYHSAYCPPNPCQFCTRNSACRVADGSRLMTSWEWCQEVNTCAATIDWDAVFGE